MKVKLAALAASLIFCGSFIGWTSYQYKQLAGHWQYSPFSGWQWANNAMYAYRYVDSSDRKNVPTQFQALDASIRSYFDSTRDVNKFQVEKVVAGTFYMWSPNLPLMKYSNKAFPMDSGSFTMRKWAYVAPLYGKYGKYIIAKYPLHYAKYFLWPNVQNFFTPPLEFLETYNSGSSFVSLSTKEWFQYKTREVIIRASTFKNIPLFYFPYLAGIFNIVFLFGMSCYFFLKVHHQKLPITNGVKLAGIIWLINAIFTIIASTAAARFQAFPFILIITFSIILLDIIIKFSIQTEVKSVTVVMKEA